MGVVMALREMVILAANGNGNAAVKLVEKFTPLLRKYAGLLQSEAGFCDLRLKLSESLTDISKFSVRVF